MIKTVHKYALRHTDLQDVHLPKSAEILTVQAQNGVLQLWALVDPEAPLVKRIIRMAGTGHPIDGGRVGKYISTVQEPPFVWHFFEPGAPS